MKPEVYARILRLPVALSLGGFLLGVLAFSAFNLLRGVQSGPDVSGAPMMLVPVGFVAALYFLHRNNSRMNIGFWQATRITFVFLFAHWVGLLAIIKKAYPEGIVEHTPFIDLLLSTAHISLSVVAVISVVCSIIYVCVANPNPDSRNSPDSG